jgi:hypothetical protein
MKKLLKLTAMIYAMALCHVSYAQGLHSGGTTEKIDPKKVKVSYAQGASPGDTIREKWYNSLILLRSIYNKSNGSAIRDTSLGTAFLLSDHGKLYLVTAKNIISTQYDKSGYLPNDTIFVSFLHINVGVNLGPKFDFNLGGLSGKDAKHPAVAFTDDENNIAIISLQKKEYKDAAAELLARGCRPILINLLDTGNDYHEGEELRRYGRSMMGRSESLGFNVCYIKDNVSELSFFTITKVPLTQGASGSIAIGNNKLIGIMTDKTEASIYRTGQPINWIAVPAKFTKSANILSCLRKLQQAENDPAFNK